MATTIQSGRSSSPLLTADVASRAEVYGGRGLVFDGATDYLQFNQINQEASPNYTLSFWANITQTPSGGYEAMIFGGGGSDYQGIAFTTSNKLYIRLRGSGWAIDNSNIVTNVSTGTWNHYVIAISSSNYSVYLNGIQIHSTNVTLTSMDTSHGFKYIGKGASGFYNGKLSDLKFFNGIVATEAQVQELYLKPESMPSSLKDYCVLWYPMSEANPESPQSIVYDHSEKKLGSEELGTWANSDFPWTTWTSSGTTVSSAISNGSATMIAVNPFSSVSGSLYKITFNVTLNSGTVPGFTIREGVTGTVGDGSSAFGTVSSGLNTHYFQASSTKTLYMFFSVSSATSNFSLSDVSVKEVLMGNHATTNFFGDELITNGDFSSATGWTDASNIISSGVAHFNTSGSEVYIEQADKTEVGKTYQLKYDITEYTSGTIKTRYAPSITLSTSVASHTTTFVAGHANFGLKRGSGSGTTNIKIDNVSLKEVGISSTGFTTAQNEPTIPQIPLIKYNKKMVFDGVDNVVPLSTNDLSSDMTICAWVSTETKASLQFIAGKWGSTNSWYIRLLTSGYLKFTVNSSGINALAERDLCDGKLHHIACVYDAGTSVKVYVDGVLEDTTTTSVPANLLDANQALRVGLESNNANPFKGIIDEVSEWNTALSQTEIISLFNDGIALDATTHSKSGNLIGYWRNDGVTTWKNRADKFASFDGVDDVITRNAINVDYKSISFWFNLKSNATSSTAYSTFGAIGSFQGSGSFITIGGSATSSVTNELITLGASGVITAWESNSDTITGNVWHHLAIVWNGSKYVIYYDGELKDTTSGSASHLSLQSNNSIIIGRNAGGSSFFNGLISNYAIWSESLTDAQVLSVYNSGHNGNIASIQSSDLELYYNFNPNALTDPDTNSTVQDRSGNDNDSTSVSGAVIDRNGTVNPTDGSVKAITIREGLNSNKDGLGFPLKNPSGNVLRLNGVNEYVDVKKSSVFNFTGDQPFTLMCWVKPRLVALMAFCYKRDGSNGIIWQMHDDGTLEFATGTGSTLEASRTTTTISVNEWTHIAVVRTGNQGKALFYKNGSLMSMNGSHDPNHTLMSDNSTIPLTIGEHGGSRYFNGLIDEFMIYNKELSLAEIQKNHKHGKGKHKND